MASSSETPSNLVISLVNNTSSSNAWAYVTGSDIDRNDAVFLLQSDGFTGYYPTSPTVNGSPLLANCHIALGAPGTSRNITIPRLAGGRIWFCIDSQLTFLLNEGPGLVEPSATNPADPNYSLQWDFCEFTYNKFQLFANITYVDFVSLPISLSLTDTSGATQTVQGLRSDGLDTVGSMLDAQTAADGQGWSNLMVQDGCGNKLRALSPNNGIVMDNSLFRGYFQPYVDQVWSKYASSDLTVSTQASWGVLKGRVANNKLGFPGTGAFARPSTADIFSCSTGPFAGYDSNTAVMGNITARLAAAFNRSTVLANTNLPADEVPSKYYRNAITNHYARIVHAVNIDGKGYAFPYDDVAASDGDSVAGTVAAGDPATFVVTVGGPAGTASRDPASSGGRSSQLVAGQRLGKRDTMVQQKVAAEEGGKQSQQISSSHWPSTDEEKTMLVATTDSAFADLERGISSRKKLEAELASTARTLRWVLPWIEAGARSLVGQLPLWARAAVSRGLVLLGLLGSFYFGFRGWGGPDGSA